MNGMLQEAMAQLRLLQAGVPLATTQALPQEPQFWMSALGLEQVDRQHSQPPLQALPQEPQFWRLVVVSMHVWEQQASAPAQPCVALQPGVHMPFVQMVPAGHAESVAQLTHWCRCRSQWPAGMPPSPPPPPSLGGAQSESFLQPGWQT
jgi:hypothetical protein